MKRSELRPDPDRVAEWLRRSRRPLARGPRKTRAKLTPGAQTEVARRCRGRCVRCGSKRRLHRHHVLPVQRWPQHEREPLNLVLVCEGCHDEHERAHRRLRREELPADTLTWIYQLGGREVLYLDRTYPRASRAVAGGSGRY